MAPTMRYPVPPDGRYFAVRGRLWRCTDPSLSDAVRQDWVDSLMAARREVGAALKADDSPALRQARARVETAKRGLGERGPVWWTDGAPDLNRRMIHTTPYADWWKTLAGATTATILTPSSSEKERSHAHPQ